MALHPAYLYHFRLPIHTHLLRQEAGRAFYTAAPLPRTGLTASLTSSTVPTPPSHKPTHTHSAQLLIIMSANSLSRVILAAALLLLAAAPRGTHARIVLRNSCPYDLTAFSRNLANPTRTYFLSANGGESDVDFGECHGPTRRTRSH